MDATSEQPEVPKTENQTSAFAEKSWEHPWSVDEIRKNSNHWSLAADVGLLEHMKEFASKLTAQAHNVSCEVSQLLYDTQLTDAKIQSVTDYFLTLSDSQFIENRVYDEDDTVTKDSPEKKEEDGTAKTREQREAEMIPRLKEAVSFGLDVINDAYDVLDVQVIDSDSEDDDDEAIPLPADEVILDPKDPYVIRPLPHLIGSRGFHEEDDVGVGDLLSDDAESEVGSMSESEEEIEKAPSVSDVSSSEYDSDDESVSDDSELEDHPVARKTTTSMSSSTDMSSSDNEELFSNKKQEYSSEEEEIDPQPRKHTSSKKRAASKRSQPEQDLFGQEEPEDDLFAGTGGLFEKGTGLFGENKGGLFDGVQAFDEEEDEELGSEEEKPEPVVAKKPKPKQAPHGGVSLFGGAIKKGFFQGQEDSEESDAAPPSPKPQKQAASSNMFDGESSDEDDLFQEKSKPTTKASSADTKPLPKTSGGLFDEDSEHEDDEMFNDVEKEEAIPEEVSPTIKRPVGGVSMFGSGGNALQEAIRRRAPSSTTDVDQRSSNLQPKSDNSQIQKSKPLNPTPSQKASLFSVSSDDEQLFGDKGKAKTTPVKKTSMKQTEAKVPLPKKNSLFRDSSDEEELFGGSTKSSTIKSSVRSGSVKSFNSNVSQGSSSRISHQNERNTAKKANSLFNDENDDGLFSAPLKAAQSVDNKSKTKSKPSPVVPRQKPGSKTNLFNDSESDDGLFTSNHAKPSSSPAVVDRLQSSDDEDEGLFSRKPAKSSFSSSSSTEKKKPLSGPKLKPNDKTQSSSLDHSKGQKAAKTATSPPNVTPALTSSKPPASKLSMFDESDSDDDLFSAMTKSKPTPAPTKPKPVKKERNSVDSNDLFPSSPKDAKAKKPLIQAKPAPAKKMKQPKGLFDSDSENDDLFGAKSPAAKVTSPDEESSKNDVMSEQEAAEDRKVALKEDEEPTRKKPAGAVSMFGAGGGELLAAISKKRSASQKSSTSMSSEKSVSSSNPAENKKEKPAGDEVGAFGSKSPSTSVSAPSTNVTPKPFSVTSSSRKPTLSRVTPPTAKQAGDGIGKLQASLSINPSALLPGAAPTIVSTVDVTAPLESATKTRSRGQAGRRPPSRQARRKIAEAATNDFMSTPATPIPTSTVAQPTSAISSPAALEPSNKKLTTAKKDDILDDILTPSVSKKDSKSEAVTKKTQLLNDIDDVDKLLGPSKDLKKAKSRTKVDDLFGLDDDNDDLFGAKPKASTKKNPPVTDDIFAADGGFEPKTSLFDSAETKKKPSSKKHNLFSDDLFGDLDDDRLSVDKTAKTNKPALDNDDDIFGSPSNRAGSKPNKAAKEEKGKLAELDGDDLFGDLTSSPTIKKKSTKDKPPKTQVDDLFGDDADMFGDLPTSKPKAKKATKKSGKTKSTPAPSLFDDDDIFSSPPKASESKTTKKKKTKKPATSSKDNPDVFDDPLNALLSP